MKPATPASVALHAKLQRLAERGVAGEATAAKSKLEKLEARYDFAAYVPAPTVDLFSGVVYASRGNSRPLDVEFRDSEIASFVKWALKAGFGVEGSIVAFDTQIRVHVEAMPESMKTLNHVATVIRDSFQNLWQTFSALPGATEKDARCFLLGLYDGMLNEERTPGTLLPARQPSAPLRKGRRRTLALAPGLAIHPYAVALDLGRKIRLSTPIDQITADLTAAEQSARLQN